MWYMKTLSISLRDLSDALDAKDEESINSEVDMISEALNRAVFDHDDGPNKDVRISIGDGIDVWANRMETRLVDLDERFLVISFFFNGEQTSALCSDIGAEWSIDVTETADGNFHVRFVKEAQ